MVITSILMFGKQRPRGKVAAGEGLTVTAMQLVAGSFSADSQHQPFLFFLFSPRCILSLPVLS